MSTNSAQSQATESQATQSQATQSQTTQAQANTTEPAPVRGTTVNKSQGGRRLENYLPPEGVPIAFDISGGGARLGAQILDIMITFGGVI
ncbi:MAG TPA: RDD family protein, partial [Roseovarius nubinhibens]|nr:RDD family protein [Roseovarius nubinhibens]